MAFNLKRSVSEAYNKGVIKAGELRDERQRKSAPVSRITTPRSHKQGFYSMTEGRWVNW